MIYCIATWAGQWAPSCGISSSLFPRPETRLVSVYAVTRVCLSCLLLRPVHWLLTDCRTLVLPGWASCMGTAWKHIYCWNWGTQPPQNFLEIIHSEIASEAVFKQVPLFHSYLYASFTSIGKRPHMLITGPGLWPQLSKLFLPRHQWILLEHRSVYTRV